MREGLIHKLVENVDVESFSIAYGDYSLKLRLLENDTGFWDAQVFYRSYSEGLFIYQVPWEQLFDQFTHVEVNRKRDNQYSRWLVYVDVIIYDLDITIRFFDEESKFSVLPIDTMKFLDNLIGYLKKDSFQVKQNRIIIYAAELLHGLCIDLPIKKWKLGDVYDLEKVSFEKIFTYVSTEMLTVKNLYEGDKLISVSVEFPSFTLLFNTDHTIEFNFK